MAKLLNVSVESHLQSPLGSGFRAIASIQGLCRDNGKENGNFYSILGVWGFRVCGFGSWDSGFRL